MIQTDEVLLEQVLKGDSDAFETLCEKYKPLVNSIARKYFLVGAGVDDLIQEGTIGLYRACLDYKKTDANASFKTFASLCIRRRIQTALKSANRNKNMPLNTYISIDTQGMLVVGVKQGENEDEEESGIYINPDLCSPEQNVISEENVEEINTYINTLLSDFEKQVLRLYVDGDNYVEIAKKLQKEPKSIDNALNRIKIKLKFLRN